MTALGGRELAIWLAGALLAGVALFGFGTGVALLCTEIMIMALFASSLNLIMSYGGMVSFGHAAYFGLGAYGFALAIVRFGIPPMVAIACGPLLAAFAAWVYGSLCVRLSHIYFAMLTLACAEITFAILFQAYDFTGGDTGLTRFVAPRFGLAPEFYGLVVLGMLLASLLIMRRLVASPLGLAIRSVGEDPHRTAALGYDPRRVQLAAFVIAGAFAGVAGMLFSAFHGNAFPDYASLAFTLDALVMVVIGGLHSFAGPLYGAITYLLMKTFVSRYVGEWELVVGIVLMVVVLAAPKGLAGLAARLGFVRKERGA